MDLLKMIAAFSNANGVSGFEDEVIQIAQTYAPAGLTLTEDSLRNLYLHRRQNTGQRPVIQVDAHSDEVGFMVHSIRHNGTLKFIALGGWINSNIPAHRVRVKTRDGNYIPGIIISKPPHFMAETEKQQIPGIPDMSIDVGASSFKEARDQFGIEIAAPVVPEATFVYDKKHDLMFGKAFDDRLGCAAVLATLEALGNDPLNVDVIATLSAQEEVGMRGAALTANVIKPSVAIVFEGCPADDTIAPPQEIQTALRKGPMLRHIDSQMISNPRFQRFALALGNELGVPVQESVRIGGATNAARIHLSNQGVPTIVIGLPVRYSHSHYGIASFEDFKSSIVLACAIIRRLDVATIRSF